MSQLSKEPKRCAWAGADPIYVAYHDEEWGVPVRDDQALFGKLILDGFQAGLSWIIILRKRPAFLKAFHGFDAARMARYGARDLKRLENDAGIVRNKQKIAAARDSARSYLALVEEEGSFSDFLWQFVDGKPKVNRWRSMSQVPAQTPESLAMSKALAARGFRFVGPTICYAFMQAVGMVNDHLIGCHRHQAVQKRR